MLPISGVAVGDVRVAGDGFYQVASLECAPKYFSIPKDCEHARKLKMDIGEFVMIQPSTNVEPFLVQCDMTTLKDAGICHTTMI